MASARSARRPSTAAPWPQGGCGAPVESQPALCALADRPVRHLRQRPSRRARPCGRHQQQRPAWRLELQWQDPAYGRYILRQASVASMASADGAGSSGPAGAVLESPLNFRSPAHQHHICGTAPGGRAGSNLEANCWPNIHERLLAGNKRPRAEGTPPTHGRTRWLMAGRTRLGPALKP